MLLEADMASKGDAMRRRKLHKVGLLGRVFPRLPSKKEVNARRTAHVRKIVEGFLGMGYITREEMEAAREQLCPPKEQRSISRRRLSPYEPRGLPPER